MTAGEVFAIGSIQEDKTVKGGTGWAVELARNWKKPVFAFDQKQDAWFHWQTDGWKQIEAPHITQGRFTGTGTRSLTDAGRRAIHQLFERSFGKKP
jgi:hypothetical protein